MYQIRETYGNEDAAFRDVDALGLFVDNHDNARFLSIYDKQWAFKNAILFSLTAKGIPYFYYGGEQFFNGGNDPANRESLWNAMDTESEMYLYVAAINQARQAAQSFEYQYVERWVTDNYFSYSRGDLLVMTTNTQADVQLTQTYVPYDDGTEVCNIFWPEVDCQTVENGSMEVDLLDGESKVWLPKDKIQGLFKR